MIKFPIISNNYFVKSPFQFERRKEIIPGVPDGFYLIELEACGICHSDLLWSETRCVNWEKIGHEFGGRILKKGNHSLLFQEGQRVAVRNATPCQNCIECKNGRPRFCQNIIVNKSGFDQFFLADERSLSDAESVDIHMLGLIEPLGVAYEAVETANVSEEDSVIIYGLGVIGLLAGWLCKKKGAKNVYGIARHSGRFSIAKLLGFSKCYEVEAPNVVQQIRLIDNCLPNKILLFAPPECLNKAISLLCLEGQIIVIGMNESEWGSCSLFDFEQLIFKHAMIKGAFAYPNLHFEKAISHIKNHSEMLNNIITNIDKIKNLPYVFKQIHTSPRDYLKVVLTK